MAEKTPGFMKKIFTLIGKSIHGKKDGKVSSTRMASYFILGAILLAAVVFVGIDIANACVAIYNKGFYEIPMNHIVIYGMTLAHHLTLLGINKNHETKVEQAIQDKMKSLNELNPKDMPTDMDEGPSDADMV
jgi:hypothetical protein